MVIRITKQAIIIKIDTSYFSILSNSHIPPLIKSKPTIIQNPYSFRLEKLRANCPSRVITPIPSSPTEKLNPVRKEIPTQTKIIPIQLCLIFFRSFFFSFYTTSMSEPPLIAIARVQLLFYFCRINFFVITKSPALIRYI